MSQHDDRAIEQLVRPLVTSLPWLSFLPEKDCEQFVAECAEALRATIGAWRNTVQDGVALSNQLSRAIDRHDGNAEAALSELFTWTNEFGVSELAGYAEEIQQLVYADAGLETFRELLSAQNGWWETAAAYAAGVHPR